MAAGKEQLIKLRISIDTPEGVPSIWRELAICGEANLAELNDAIQICFGWAGIHKHEFVASDGSWKATDPQFGPPEFDDSYKNEEEVALAEVAGEKGTMLTYNYDLTDPWAHIVQVIDVQTGNFQHRKTQLTGGERSGIPEDCGGASGFQEFLEAVRDPDDPEHNAMTAWYKTECANGAAKYDADFVDFDKINSRLATKAP